MEEAKRKEEVLFNDTEEESQNFIHEEWDTTVKEGRRRLYRDEDFEIYSECKRTMLTVHKELKSRNMRNFTSYGGAL